MNPYHWTPDNPIPFYHGTTEEAWEKIQTEGVLWGVGDSYRYTYLTPEIEVARTIGHGKVILKVQYKPTGIKGVGTYGFDPNR